MAITGRSRMRISVGSDIFNAGRAFPTQNRSLVVPGSGAVKSGELSQVNTLRPWSHFLREHFSTSHLSSTRRHSALLSIFFGTELSLPKILRAYAGALPSSSCLQYA